MSLLNFSFFLDEELGESSRNINNNKKDKFFVYLDETIIVGIFGAEAVLVECFLDSERGRVLVGQEQGLVGNVGLERLAVHLERAAAVAILDLFQFVLEFLLSTSCHHDLGVRDRTREIRIGHFFVQVLGHFALLFLLFLVLVLFLLLLLQLLFLSK